MIHKHRDLGYLCCYCTDAFQEPKDLKEHTLTKHRNKKVSQSHVTTQPSSRLIVKLDITNLKCIICDNYIDSLEDLIVHLTDKHEKKFHTNIKNQIFPFKFHTKRLECCRCNNGNFSSFKALHEHMHKHYRNYICKECDAGFINCSTLTNHAIIHKKGTFVCRHCPNTFDSLLKRRTHEFRYHGQTGGKFNKCSFCNEGFKEFVQKEAHLVAVHGVTPRKYDCTACDRSFSDNSLLNIHVRRFHLQEKNYKCTDCGKAFFRNVDLKKHMLVHTGAKNFKCEICSKFFSTNYIRGQHMKIHNNDKRYKCTLCNKAFVQKPHLKKHLKKHADAC